MTTVFLSGSRNLGRINDAVRARLDNMIDNCLEIMVGDANGADKAMQAYLAQREYSRVTVYFVGTRCRNNVGKWKSQNVPVNSHLTGRQFYSQKDKKMASIADFGFVLWDGKSAGSIENIFEIVKHNKKALVYFSPDKEFLKLTNPEDISALLSRGDEEVITDLDRKLGFARMFREIEEGRQARLDLVQ